MRKWISLAWSGLSGRSKPPLTGHDLDDQHDHRDHEKRVNEAATETERPSADPEDDEDHDDEPEQITNARTGLLGTCHGSRPSPGLRPPSPASGRGH